ncbi:MAG: serine hydrolase domain-containing protein, partial [Gemmatimonadales bacterium]
MLGLLIDDGKCALDSRAAEAAPEMAPAYPTVTLRHFTTMTSGYRAAGDEPKGSYKHGPSGTPFIPSPQPLFTPPGSQYAYWDSAMNMFGLVLTRIAKEPLEELFRRRLADPIGMDPLKWDWGEGAADGGVVVNGGSGNSNQHIFISAREMARFGHLFLNQGGWNGRQLISRDWVRQATSVQVEGSTPWAQPESKIDGRGSYGFNWWRNGEGADGRRKWPAAPAGTFAAMGHNNNVCFVVPEWQLVIVRLGLDEADHKVTDQEWSGFLRQVGLALRDARDGGRPGSQPARPAAGPLRVHPDNPRYFTDGARLPDGSLKALLLTGSHTWNNLVDMDRGDPPAPFDFEAYLGFLERHGHNFIRLWTWDTATWDTRTNGDLGKDFVHQVAPLP